MSKDEVRTLGRQQVEIATTSSIRKSVNFKLAVDCIPLGETTRKARPGKRLSLDTVGISGQPFKDIFYAGQRREVRVQ